MRAIGIVNFAEIAGRGWTFLQERIHTKNVSWSFHSATPKYWIERFVKRPNLARLRASLHAGFCARGTRAGLIISHLPRATLWSVMFSRLFLTQSKHLAFSFNFTELPNGLNKTLMRRAFKTVDRFVVFSEAEKHLYASFFGLNIDRFNVVRWCMDKPKTMPLSTELPERYICAVGGEGRDYKTLLSVSQLLPSIPIVIVARPESMVGLHLPENVILFTNVKNEEFWYVVQQSSFVVLPLKDPNTNCGHISIVGSQLLGKPIVSTQSSGTQEYLQHNFDSLLSPAGDSDGLAENINILWEDKVLHSQFCSNVLTHSARYSMDIWVNYLDNYIHQSFGE